jgi:hypothetical protein
MRPPTAWATKVSRNPAFWERPKGCVLGAMAFVVVAVLGSTVTVSAVFLMYVLGRRWM